MKTIKKGIYLLLIALFLTLTACASEKVVEEEIVEEPLTKVKVVRLSYETQGQELRTNNIFKLNASKKTNYIFPGDELAFTVEIEDPNFEFISLLSLKLNDQMIRANTADAITSTRDCGVNICVDFPYPVSSGVTTYSLTELKFARLGSDDPIDAIIENDAVSVSIEIWEDPVSPYVLDAVQILNESLNSWIFFNSEEYNFHLQAAQKRDLGEGLSDEEVLAANILSEQTALRRKFLFTNFSESTISEYQDNPDFIPIDITTIDSNFVENQYIEFFFQEVYDEETETVKYCILIEIFIWEKAYLNIYFANKGNSLYLNVLDQEIFIIEFDLRTVVEEHNLFS